MRYQTRRLAVLLLCFCARGAFGQDAPKAKAPLSVEPYALKMRFKSLNNLSPQMKAAIAQQTSSASQATASQGQPSSIQDSSMSTIPFWSGSFTYQGTKY